MRRQSPPGESIVYGGDKDDEGVDIEIIIYFRGPQPCEVARASIEAFDAFGDYSHVIGEG